MNVKEYMRGHKGTIKKSVIIGVPAAAGIAIGCGHGSSFKGRPDPEKRTETRTEGERQKDR